MHSMKKKKDIAEEGEHANYCFELQNMRLHRQLNFALRPTTSQKFSRSFRIPDFTNTVDITKQAVQFRGAPPMVASGRRSTVYLWEARYMIGTPGICRQPSPSASDIQITIDKFRRPDCKHALLHIQAVCQEKCWVPCHAISESHSNACCRQMRAPQLQACLIAHSSSVANSMLGPAVPAVSHTETHAYDSACSLLASMPCGTKICSSTQQVLPIVMPRSH